MLSGGVTYADHHTYLNGEEGGEEQHARARGTV